ncbi:MAG: hypothetical protein FWF36_02325 [Propionibacteriaceae bacterium]|nr:hypothetical protein [Propionibacteriaceae bacterium]
MSDSQANPSVTGETFPPPPYGAALLPDDPPRIGDFWLDGRLAARASGIAFLAHEAAPQPKPGAPSSNSAEPAAVMLIVLSQGATDDAAARDRLAGEVNKMHADTVIARGGTDQDDGRLADKFRPEADEPVPTSDVPTAPWVALAYDGTVDAIAEADRVLRSVDLSSTPPLGTVRGPGFQLPWITQTKPGNWRRWPLPWGGRTDRGSWVSVLVSWLLMLALAAIALLIVILLFQNPPPPSGSGGQGGGDSSATSSSSAEGSGSGSPSDSSSGSGSGSPSESPSESGTESGSPSESGSESGSPSQGGHDSPTQSASMMSPTTGSGTVGQPSLNPDLWLGGR